MSTFFLTFAIAIAIGTYIVSIVMSQVAETSAGRYLSHGTLSPTVDAAMIRMSINICLIIIAVGFTAIGDKAGPRSLLLLVVYLLSAIFAALLVYEKDGFSKGFAFMSVACLIFGVGFFPSVKLADFGWTTLICAITTPASILLHKNAEKIYNWLLPIRNFLQTNTFVLILGAVSLFLFGLGTILILYSLVGPGIITGVGFGLFSWCAGFVSTFWAMGIGQEYDKPSAIACAICALICAYMGIVIVLV